jgi:uracil-DNA glycosylase
MPTSERAAADDGPEPPVSCSRCERLASFRRENAVAAPDWFNAPVPSFGKANARLLVVGLAPGLRGANRTGRPFTGDFAGDLLYATLLDYGFARGSYAARPDDGLELVDTLITNSVRCVPPENRPTGGEIAACRPFLVARMAALPRLQAILVLGKIAHDSTLQALGVRKSSCPFKHGARHRIRDDLVLFDSYHCSRYNTNTGKLTTEMFHSVFADVRAYLDAEPPSS